MPRFFVAIDLPKAVKDSLEPLTCGLGDVCWLADDQLHLTLRFIGEIDNGQAEEVAEVLSLVPGSSFDLRLRGIGHFPPRGEPRIIWTGVEHQPELNRLKRRIDRALRRVGVERDTRRYSPHVTLARLRRPPIKAELATYFMRYGLYQSPNFSVNGFKLYSSWLRTEGADRAAPR